MAKGENDGGRGKAKGAIEFKSIGKIRDDETRRRKSWTEETKVRKGRGEKRGEVGKEGREKSISY